MLRALFSVVVLMLAGCQATTRPDDARSQQGRERPDAAGEAAGKSLSAAIVETTMPGWKASAALAPIDARSSGMRPVCLYKDSQESLIGRKGPWRVVSSQNCMIDELGHERFYLDFRNKTIYLAASERGNNFSGSKGRAGRPTDESGRPVQWYCTRSTLAGITRSRNDNYNICTSEFTQTVATPASVITNTLFAPIAVLAHATDVVVDTGKLYEAAVESGALSGAWTEFHLAAQQGIGTARTLNDLKAARVQHDAILYDDESLKRLYEDREAKLRQAERESQKSREQQEGLEIEKRRVAVARFRRTVSAGMDSHCGLVLSVNGPVAMVQGPAGVGQYGMRISELYPAGLASCRFVNGIYQRPNIAY